MQLLCAQDLIPTTLFWSCGPSPSCLTDTARSSSHTSTPAIQCLSRWGISVLQTVLKGIYFVCENQCLELTNPTKTMWFEWSNFLDAMRFKRLWGMRTFFVCFVSRFIIKRIRTSDTESQHKLLFLGLNICWILLFMQSAKIKLNKHC